MGWIDDKWNEDDPKTANYKANVDGALLKVAAVRAGIGQGRLPKFLAEKYDDLQHLAAYETIRTIDLWLLYHPDLKTVPKIQALGKFLRTKLKLGEWEIE